MLAVASQATTSEPTISLSSLDTPVLDPVTGCRGTLLNPAFVEEIPEEVKSQVLDSSLLLSSADETSIEDPPIEESCDSEPDELECVNVDDYIARELEDLMAKLCRPSLVEYRGGAAAAVPGTSGFVPWEEYPEIYEEETLSRRSV